jgi:hypothetical protein
MGLTKAKTAFFGDFLSNDKNSALFLIFDAKRCSVLEPLYCHPKNGKVKMANFRNFDTM